jgi:chemotaxis protein MotB
MRRKKTHEAPENHERWLVSYADFITLLFAFFVVMFATSKADHSKAQQVSDSVKKALSSQVLSPTIASILGGTLDDKGKGNAQLRGPGGAKKEDRKQRDMVELLPSLKILSKELEEELRKGTMQISMQPRGLTISFAQAALFPSGADDISPASYPSIEKVARAMRKIPNPVRLEGHTDAIPIHTARFRSNWDLSAGRSIALLNLLTDRFGVPLTRVSIAGYAETAPLATNDDPEGRARNRRVDIVILNETGLMGEPERYKK